MQSQVPFWLCAAEVGGVVVVWRMSLHNPIKTYILRNINNLLILCIILYVYYVVASLLKRMARSYIY